MIGIMVGFYDAFQFQPISSKEFIDMFDICNPFLEIHNVITLLMTTMEGKTFFHICLKLMMELVFGEVQSGSNEKGISGLQTNGKIPECLVTLSGAEYLSTHILFPVFGKIAIAEFCHELSEGEVTDVFMVNRQSFPNMVILQGSSP